jgi:hypothetical protein
MMAHVLDRAETDSFIVARVLVAVTVIRIDIKPIQLRKCRESIRKIAGALRPPTIGSILNHLPTAFTFK